MTITESRWTLPPAEPPVLGIHDGPGIPLSQNQRKPLGLEIDIGPGTVELPTNYKAEWLQLLTNSTPSVFEVKVGFRIESSDDFVRLRNCTVGCQHQHYSAVDRWPLTISTPRAAAHALN